MSAPVELPAVPQTVRALPEGMTRLRLGVPGLTVHRYRPPAFGRGPLVVCFTSSGNHVRPGHIEFSGLVRAAGRPALWIAAQPRSFYSHECIADAIAGAVRHELQAVRAAETITLGFSMGGYGAIAFADRFPVRFALAFAPRWSPDQAVVPYPVEADLREPLPFRTLSVGLAAVGEAIVVHGLRGPDLMQARGFPRQDHLHHWLLRRAEHNVPGLLRHEGRLAGVVLPALAGDAESANSALRNAGAHRIGSLGARLDIAIERVPVRVRRMIRAVLPRRSTPELPSGART